MDATSKYEDLRSHLEGLGSVLVAYSGGIDSTLLAYVAHSVLGERSLAIMAVSEIHPTVESEHAREAATRLSIPFQEVVTDELADPHFHENPPERCYHCKRQLFGVLRAQAEARGFAYVADGSNTDDLADHRPGARAARELGVVSPLQSVGMTKADIREVARTLTLPNWDKPAMACLASRFPYGEPISRERLQQVAMAEESLGHLGLRQFRVRTHGQVARIEVAPDQMARAWTMREALSEAVRAAGYAYAALDLEGYRSGSLNETLGASRTREDS